MNRNPFSAIKGGQYLPECHEIDQPKFLSCNRFIGGQYAPEYPTGLVEGIRIKIYFAIGLKNKTI